MRGLCHLLWVQMLMPFVHKITGMSPLLSPTACLPARQGSDMSWIRR